MESIQSKRRIEFGLKYKGPYAGEMHELDSLPHGSPVLVFRNKHKKWEGPFKFLEKTGETVVVQLPSGRKIFRSCAISPYKVHGNIEPCSDGVAYDSILALNEAVFSANVQSDQYRESRRFELQGFIDQGVFEVIRKLDAVKGVQIHKTKWVDSQKPTQSGMVTKSRLVARNYRDLGAECIATRSPTVSRMAQRLAVCIAAIYPELDSYVRDISQVYIQNQTTLERPVYLLPPAERRRFREFVAGQKATLWNSRVWAALVSYVS